MRVLALFVVGSLQISAQLSRDPAELLEQVRDKLIARIPPTGYACTATINRSYFNLNAARVTRKSCEQMSADRKKNHSNLQLDKTDRLRLQVLVTSAGEIYAWTGPGSFSRDVDDVVHSGDIGTGPLAAHLDAVFANPRVAFRLLGENGNSLEFGFRVPVEASSYLVKAGSQWRETGYAGALDIDQESLELKQLTVKTEELPRESSLCEANTTMSYPAGSGGVLLPSTVRTHDLNRDASETEWLSTFSGCREEFEKLPEPPRPALFPATFAAPLKLALTAPIDTATAAAGDVIKARLLETVVGPAQSLAPVGATLTGRIMRLEHQVSKPRSFLIWMDFDKIEANGVISSIHARLTGGDDLDPQHRCSVASMSDQKWDRAFLFHSNSPQIVLRAGYTSKWLTGVPASN